MSDRFCLRVLAASLCALLSSIASSRASAQSVHLPEKERLSDPIAGRAIVDELLGARPVQDLTFYGKLVTRDASGAQSELPFRYQITVLSNGWKAAYETRPSPGIASEKLIVIHADGRPNQYLFARAQKPGDAPVHFVPVEPQNTAVAFGRSDFWICDLGLEFLHWPKQVLIAKEMKKSRPCKVIESINPHPERGGYAKVRSWIDNESGGVIQALAFGERDKVWKEFSVRALEKIESQWQVKKIEMRNTKTDTKTDLDFEYQQPAGSSP